MGDPVEETVHIYDRRADEYAGRWLNSPVVTRQCADFAASIDRSFGLRILDIGCGPGRDAKYFLDREFEVVGIDLSGGLLKIARQEVPGATFFKMDMRHLGFAPASFGGLWVCASFLHIPKKEGLDTLCGFRRILRSGGSLFLSIKEGDGEAIDGRGIFYAYYQAGELRQLVETAGFETIRLDRSSGHAVFIDVFARAK